MATAPAPALGWDARPSSILIIEDRCDLARLLEVRLREQGYRAVTSAHDGPQGLDLAVRRRPELIVLDQTLPRLSGPDVLASLVRDRRTAGIPVVVLATRGEKVPAPGELLAWGAARVHVNPLDVRRLVADVVALAPPGAPPAPAA